MSAVMTLAVKADMVVSDLVLHLVGSSSVNTQQRAIVTMVVMILIQK
jgi:hypothetical protein